MANLTSPGMRGNAPVRRLGGAADSLGAGQTSAWSIGMPTSYQCPVYFRLCLFRPARWAGNPAAGRAYRLKTTGRGYHGTTVDPPGVGRALRARLNASDQRPIGFRLCLYRPARWAGNPAAGRADSLKTIGRGYRAGEPTFGCITARPVARLSPALRNRVE